MIKNVCLLLMTCLFAMAADVQAQGWGYQDSCCDEASCCVDKMNFYAKISGGANFLQNTSTDGNKFTYQTGYIVAGSLGYCWRYGLCLEAEYAYRRNAIKKIDFFIDESSNKGHFQASSYMVNLLWNLPSSVCESTLWDIHPYIGAGIGYDTQQIHSSNSQIIFNQKWRRFSWQVMAGLACPILCNTEMTLEYKFHQAGCHFYSHSVGVGIIYKMTF